MIHLVESSIFEPFIALTITANIVTMAANSPLDPPGTPKAEFIEVCGMLFYRERPDPHRLLLS
jgi:hypothetical protein